MFAKSLAVLAVAATVAAQSSASGTAASANPSASAILGSLSPCILACVFPAATQNNCSFTDVACVCASAQFQVDAAACLQEHCTAADLTAALALQTSQCSAAGVTPTGSASVPVSVPFTLASSGSATATSTGKPATTSGAASATTPATTATTPATTAATSATAPAASNTGSSAQSLTVGFAGILAAVAGVLAL